MIDQYISKEDIVNVRLQVEELIKRGYADELRKEEIIKGKINLIREQRIEEERKKPKDPFNIVP